MKRSTKSPVVLTMAATLALSFTTLAAAQSDALASLYVSAANVPTNITSIHTYAEAPKGFPFHHHEHEHWYLFQCLWFRRLAFEIA
jgi:hypothetical protein